MTGVKLGWAGGVAGLREMSDSQKWINSSHMPPVILANGLVLRSEILLWLLNGQMTRYFLCPPSYFFTVLEELMVRPFRPTEFRSGGNDSVARMPFS